MTTATARVRPDPGGRSAWRVKHLGRLAVVLWIGLGGTPPTAVADWQVGSYLDLSYADDLQGPEPVVWRSKLTSNRLNRVTPNLGMAYLRKTRTDDSPWGLELGGQAGHDTDGQLPMDDPLPGAEVLRYFSAANLSYRLPVGNGLTVSGGLLNSFIGFESFYAGKNPNYTRSWIADYSPYFLIGAGGEYPVNDAVGVNFYVVSDYDYLARPNRQPKYAAQAAIHLSPEWTLTQNVFAGPEQTATELRYWRGFSDTILHWTRDEHLAALVFDVGTEQLADNHRQAVWLGSALFTRWNITGPWSVGLRPEVYWDPDGAMTGARQFIKAVTSTLEYRLNLARTSLTGRLEFRHDDSTGPDGGFYNPRPGASGLIPGQNLLFFSCLWGYDAP